MKSNILKLGLNNFNAELISYKLPSYNYVDMLRLENLLEIKMKKLYQTDLISV
jgi:hypothetical protein